MNNISEHISHKEATKSNTAIRYGLKNEPNEEQLAAMKIVAKNCFEPVRNYHGKPIGITSFFRSPEVNVKVGGSKNSAHCKGEAIDIDADMFDNGISNSEIFYYIKDHCVFDKLIWEYGTALEPNWVHVASKESGNRRIVLRCYRKNGDTIYEPF